MKTNNLQIEGALLGGLISDSNCQESRELFDTVSETDFSDLKNKYVFRFVKRMHENRLPIDYLSLAEKLDEAGKLESVGGFPYIQSLTQLFTSKATLGLHAKTLSDLRVKRDLAHISQKLNSMIQEKKPNDEIIADIEDELRQLSTGICGTELSHIKDACGDWLDNMDDRIERGGGLNGLSTGFDELDMRLGGLGDEALITVVGRPSHGKTLWTQAISQNVGVDQKKGVLFFSMEMSATELYERFVSGVSNACPNKLRTATLDDETNGRVEIGVKRLQDSEIYFTDEPTQSLGQIRAKARRHKNKHENLSLIVIDYLGMMELPEASRHDISIGKITKGLKQLAKEIKVPIILIAQASRNLDKATSPTMSDIKDSSSIEADSDVVIFVNRPEVADPETELKGVTEIIIAKDRHNSGNGTVYMEKMNGTFSELNSEAMGLLKNKDEDRMNPKNRERGMG